ncbi:hypothetical protein FRAHR75_540043 [Frankia sp. Hr75.2]|nr:hypothetical protein FRAHR75_540043 [Frankia sp. Hr75.2]
MSGVAIMMWLGLLALAALNIYGRVRNGPPSDEKWKRDQQAYWDTRDSNRRQDEQYRQMKERWRRGY